MDEETWVEMQRRLYTDAPATFATLTDLADDGFGPDPLPPTCPVEPDDRPLAKVLSFRSRA